LHKSRIFGGTLQGVDCAVLRNNSTSIIFFSFSDMLQPGGHYLSMMKAGECRQRYEIYKHSYVSFFPVHYSPPHLFSPLCHPKLRIPKRRVKKQRKNTKKSTTRGLFPV
jgi:hypothetical protein